MALEIRELVVKVIVEDTKTNENSFSRKDRNQLLEDCKKAVLKSLKNKKQR